MVTWIFAMLAFGWLVRVLIASRSARLPPALPQGGGVSLGGTHIELRIAELEIAPGDRAAVLAALGAYAVAERDVLNVPADGSTMLVFAMQRVSKYAKRVEGHTEVLQPSEAREKLASLADELAQRRARTGPAGYRDGPRELLVRPEDPVVMAIAVALATHPTIAARPFRGQLDDFVRDLVVGREVLLKIALHPVSTEPRR